MKAKLSPNSTEPPTCTNPVLRNASVALQLREMQQRDTTVAFHLPGIHSRWDRRRITSIYQGEVKLQNVATTINNADSSNKFPFRYSHTFPRKQTLTIVSSSSRISSTSGKPRAPARWRNAAISRKGSSLTASRRDNNRRLSKYFSTTPRPVF